MTPARILDRCRRAGVGVFLTDCQCESLDRCRRTGRDLPKSDCNLRLRVLVRGELPPDLRGLLKNHRPALFKHLSEPPSQAELQAVRATGRNPSPLLLRHEAHLLAALPPPRKATPWELLIDGYFPIHKDQYLPPWEFEPATRGQLVRLRLCGYSPPVDATKGEASFAISALNKGYAPPPAPAPAMPLARVAADPVPAVLKWHGGKHYLAKRIIDLMPSHTTYCEVFAGGLSVLLAKDPEGISEVVNDADGRLTNFWRVLRSPERFAEFERIVQAIPHSEAEWRATGKRLDNADSVQRAVAFFVRCRQSMGGRLTHFASGSKCRTRRGMNDQVSSWLSAVAGLPAVHARLQRVAIRCRQALDVIRAEDSPATLFYCDPPYLKSTRTSPNVYSHEMTKADHRDLLEALKQVKGKVMLSGYPSRLYDRYLADWTRHEFDLPNNAATGASKRRMTEVLWTNF